MRQILLISVLSSTLLSACVTNRTFGEGVDDSATSLSIASQILFDRNHNYSDVDVTIFEGRLLLSGNVKTEEARRDIASRAQVVPSISEVLNEIVIGPKTSFRQGAKDALIDRRYAAAIVADNGIYAGNYKISVSNGTVYLLGVAQGPAELSRATAHAQTIDGVQNVVSHVVFVGDPRRQ